MTRVRPCEPEDVPAVASLFERVSRSGSRIPAAGLAGYFERTLFGSPWRDPELPSFVFELDGAIVAFIGVHVRRVLFDGRPLRMVYTAQLVSDPDAPGRPGGALLLRRALSGPQDLTIGSAGMDVSRMWESLGGRVLPLTSVSWAKVFGPARWMGNTALARAGRASWRPYARPLLSFIDRVGARTLGGEWQALEPSSRRTATRSEPLTPSDVLTHLPRLAPDARLRPDYDEPFLTWLFLEMAAVTGLGTLAARLVHDAEDRVLGWYVAHLHPRHPSRVLQIVASEADADRVVDHLFKDARLSGTPVLQGRLEPLLFRTLWERRCQLWWGNRDLLHSRDQNLITATLLGKSIVTRMDGEAWMGHAFNPVPCAPCADGPSHLGGATPPGRQALRARAGLPGSPPDRQPGGHQMPGRSAPPV